MDAKQLGSIVNIYPTECDDTEVSNTQNSHSDNSSEPRKVSFNEEQQPRKEMNGNQHSQNTTSQSVYRTSSVMTNINSSTHRNPNEDHHIISSKRAAHNNGITVTSVDPVNIISSENSNKSPKDNQNENRPLRTQPENICQHNTPNKKPNDTETDAKPYPAQSRENDFPQSGTEGVKFEPSKETEEMQCFENSILRPKDHFNQSLTPEHLIDTVIVYAKSDYKLALAYERYLRSIASANNMNDIQIKLYTSEDFPNNDVKVVKEIVNRSMRILMLLSADFTSEMSLSFIKDETIGMTTLQEFAAQEHMSSSYTTIIHRQKNCLRAVHTVSKKERYYRTPAGLSALRAFEFFPDNRNQTYEDDITLDFLRKAREDRLSHVDELKQHQSLDNPNISQVSEKGRAGQFLSCNPAEFDVTVKRDESLENNILSSTDMETCDSICETPLITSEGGGKSARQNLQENTSVICQWRLKVETNTSDGSNTQVYDNLSCATSGFVSNLSSEHVAMGKALKNVPSSKTNAVNNQMKHDSSNSKLPIPNKSENSDPAKKSPIEKDSICFFEQGDEEEDKTVDSMMGASLESDETKVNQDKLPIQSTQGHQHVMRQAKMKDIDLESLGDVRESKISYSGPSGRSGIRTGANPEYGEYLKGKPNGKTHGSSNSMDNSDRHGTRKQPTKVAPNFARYPPPQSIHYHYHYDQGQGEDVETDSGHGSLGAIINIKSNTVVLGNENRVIYNQEIKETNKNGSTNDDAINNRNEQRGHTLPDSSDITMEEKSAINKSQPEGSLNILSPISDPTKMVNDESSDNNSDEDNIKIEPESKCIKSGEMFSNGADLTKNVTSICSNCTDQNKTENATIVKENFTNEKEESGPDEDDKSVENSEDCYNVFQCLDCVSVNDY